MSAEGVGGVSDGSESVWAHQLAGSGRVQWGMSLNSYVCRRGMQGCCDPGE